MKAFWQIIGLLIAFIGGVMMTVSDSHVHFDRECIEHHAAHYDPQTGIFIWNDEKETK